MEGESTGDGRIIKPGSLRWDVSPENPIPLRYVSSDVGAHDGAVVVGLCDSIERREDGIIWGEGPFDLDSEAGREASRQVKEKLTNGVSMDLDDVTFEVDSEPMAEGGGDIGDLIQGGETMTTTDARIRAATIVAIPAFTSARIAGVYATGPDDSLEDNPDVIPGNNVMAGSTQTFAFNPKQWRVPGGNGRLSGRWLNMPNIDGLISELDELNTNGVGGKNTTAALGKARSAKANLDKAQQLRDAGDAPGAQGAFGQASKDLFSASTSLGTTNEGLTGMLQSGADALEIAGSVNWEDNDTGPGADLDRLIRDQLGLTPEGVSGKDDPDAPVASAPARELPELDDEEGVFGTPAEDLFPEDVGNGSEPVEINFDGLPGFITGYDPTEKKYEITWEDPDTGDQSDWWTEEQIRPLVVGGEAAPDAAPEGAAPDGDRAAAMHAEIVDAVKKIAGSDSIQGLFGDLVRSPSQHFTDEEAQATLVELEDALAGGDIPAAQDAAKRLDSMFASQIRKARGARQTRLRAVREAIEGPFVDLDEAQPIAMGGTENQPQTMPDVDDAELQDVADAPDPDEIETPYTADTNIGTAGTLADLADSMGMPADDVVEIANGLSDPFIADDPQAPEQLRKAAADFQRGLRTLDEAIKDAFGGDESGAPRTEDGERQTPGERVYPGAEEADAEAGAALDAANGAPFAEPIARDQHIARIKRNISEGMTPEAAARESLDRMAESNAKSNPDIAGEQSGPDQAVSNAMDALEAGDRAAAEGIIADLRRQQDELGEILYGDPENKEAGDKWEALADAESEIGSALIEYIRAQSADLPKSKVKTTELQPGDRFVTSNGEIYEVMGAPTAKREGRVSSDGGASRGGGKGAASDYLSFPVMNVGNGQESSLGMSGRGSIDRLDDPVTGENGPAAPVMPNTGPVGGVGPSAQEKIDNAEKMFGTGSKQHEEAKKRFGPQAEADAALLDEGGTPEFAPPGEAGEPTAQDINAFIDTKLDDAISEGMTTSDDPQLQIALDQVNNNNATMEQAARRALLGQTGAPAPAAPTRPANWDEMGSSEKDLWEERNGIVPGASSAAQQEERNPDGESEELDTAGAPDPQDFYDEGTDLATRAGEQFNEDLYRTGLAEPGMLGATAAGLDPNGFAAYEYADPAESLQDQLEQWRDFAMEGNYDDARYALTQAIANTENLASMLQQAIDNAEDQDDPDIDGLAEAINALNDLQDGLNAGLREIQNGLSQDGFAARRSAWRASHRRMVWRARHDAISQRYNWVEDVGGLPRYIKRIAKHLKAKGMTESHAIASAVNTVKRWARGGGDVKPDTIAKAVAALAEWEAKKAAAHARSAQTITASGAPVAPPLAWFDQPRLDGPTPLTVDDDGRVYGHLATWNVCHLASPNGAGVCVVAPHSQRGYQDFHTGGVKVKEGKTLATGRITLDTNHAGPKLNAISAAAHYDHTGNAVADVRAGEDEYGIWVAGALRPGVGPSKIRALRASPLSGDWRERGGSLELVAALAVNVPGFPVPRPSGLVASANPADLSDTGELVSLVAAGMLAPRQVIKPGTPDALSDGDIKYLKQLAARERATERETLATRVAHARLAMYRTKVAAFAAKRSRGTTT